MSPPVSDPHPGASPRTNSRRKVRARSSLTRLQLEIRPQPDDQTCGPTCLHAVYRYFGDSVPLHELVRQIPQLPDGGTLGVLLGLHALRRGYDARLYTYNLRMFDPTWFAPGRDVVGRLQLQARHARSPRVRMASLAYVEFLELGGEVRLEDLTPALLRRHLKEGVPLLTGLNATYLYRCARERSRNHKIVADDVAGEPTGHFVVIHGYDKRARQVFVADPYGRLPPLRGQRYTVSIERLLCAIMLGIVTYDANILVIRPGGRSLHP
jgi:hypothetical protein